MLSKIKHIVQTKAPFVVLQETKGVSLFLSITDGTQRAKVYHFFEPSFEKAWAKIEQRYEQWRNAEKPVNQWLRVDWTQDVKKTYVAQLEEWFKAVKRNYFRWGIIFGDQLEYTFTEQELNANAMLYGGVKVSHVILNRNNFSSYARKKYGSFDMALEADMPLWMLDNAGIFVANEEAPVLLYGKGRDAGRRHRPKLSSQDIEHLIQTSSQYLTTQVQASGRFYYGWHPCFDREIQFYNALRHCSTIYSMVEAWEVTQSQELLQAIQRALDYALKHFVKIETDSLHITRAYVVEHTGKEIKLGANAVLILALCKYSELIDPTPYADLLEQLALGIESMQDPDTGQFSHVLNYPDLTVKEAFRIIYYDGEAAFGLMRLYGLTKDPRWLSIVEKAFEYFIENEHWRAHDHWLSYCVNELTLYREEKKYYLFGLQNIKGYLDFVANRITTFPTLLELMMAAQRMVERLQSSEAYRYLLDDLDIDAFYHALEKRAHYLLNGYFAPEIAMYFANPQRITGSFFIRHHSFRVRIDDVEHYLSGYVAYLKYVKKKHPSAKTLITATDPIFTWGGDINLGRRQHYRTAELGVKNVLAIPSLQKSDVIAINLECVLTTKGTQGIAKGEGGPYYYRARPEMVEVLLEAGVDIVTTANNHAGDYGPDALLQQNELLEAVGLQQAGSGRNRSEALQPVFRSVKGINFALFSIDTTQRHFAATERAAGTAYFDPTRPKFIQHELEPLIKQARRQAQVVLVAVHYGANGTRNVTSESQALAHALIDAGADAVLGSSAHELQGIEVYKNRPIIHDAGDLLFDAVQRKSRRGGIFQLILCQQGVKAITFIPVAVGYGQTHELVGAAAEQATKDYIQLCSKLKTSLTKNKKGQGYIAFGIHAEKQAMAYPYFAAPTKRKFSAAFMPELAGQWVVKRVPEQALIVPLCFGPIQLLGVRVINQHLKQRQMIWVESFWTLTTKTQENLRIDFQAVPLGKTTMRPWGRAMDHDPCDWLKPVSTWEPGVIYRDFYGLRPPYLNAWSNGELQLVANVIAANPLWQPVPLPIKIRLNHPAKEPLFDDKGDLVFSNHYSCDFSKSRSASEISGQTWNAEQLETITGGRWLVRPPENWYVKSVVAGQRHIPLLPGPTLFIGHDTFDRARHENSSIPNKNFDRHEIIKKHTHQLAGAIVSKKVAGLPSTFPILYVPDPIKAFITLGLAARQRFNGTVIAVTGTAGKSSTVDMMKTLLSHADKSCLASIDNYNSRVGAPGLLASLSADYEVAVVEVAQSALWMKRGPITRLLQPNIAVITSIGLSQVEQRVKTLKEAAYWKSRVFDSLQGAKVAVINENIPFCSYVIAEAKKHADKVFTYGQSAQATVRIKAVTTSTEGTVINLIYKNEEISYRISGFDQGSIENSLAVFCINELLKIDREKFISAMENYSSLPARMKIDHVSIAGKAITLIDDSYNATYISMLNAFELLKKYPSQGRKVAVLGRIVYLGAEAQSIHEDLAEPLVDTGVSLIITHGEEMKYLRKQVPPNLLGPHFLNHEDLCSYIDKNLQKDDVVLLKGSRRDSDFSAISDFFYNKS